jgi:hypothetical protein
MHGTIRRKGLLFNSGEAATGDREGRDAVEFAEYRMHHAYG